jgi:glycosyltransferase involved in cell wall biosynthesis
MAQRPWPSVTDPPREGHGRLVRLAWLCADTGIPYGATKGAALHLSALVQAVAEQGTEVLLLVAAAEPGATAPPGVRVEILPGPGPEATTAERLAFDPERGRWLRRRLAAFGAQALYERLSLHTAAGAQAAASLGIPHLVEINAPLRWEAATFRRLPFPEAAARLERRTLTGAALALPVSRPLAEYARAHGARAASVLPNAAWPGAPQAPADAPAAAVFAGSLRPWHGTDTIAEAWDLMGEAAPPLTVIGDGPGRSRLEAAGAHVTGQLAPDAARSALACASIGLAPYTADGPAYFSPLKLFDYLAAGLAVVAGRLPGVADVVDDRSAVLIAPGDAGALARAVTAITADDSRRAALGAAGRAQVLADHTWPLRAEQVLALAAAAVRQPKVAA